METRRKRATALEQLEAGEDWPGSFSPNLARWYREDLNAWLKNEFGYIHYMKRLFTSSDLILVSQLKSILEAEGIACVVKNEILGSLVGEIPFPETFPELWIQNDSDLPGAEAIKRDWKGTAHVGGHHWTCPTCGEHLEAQFSSCWKCGTQQPVQSGVA